MGDLEENRYRAVVLGDFSPMTARVVWTWLKRGNCIDFFGAYFDPKMAAIRLDRRLAWLRPGWSVSAALKRYRIPLIDVRNSGALKDPTLVRRVADADLLLSSLFQFKAPAVTLAAANGKALNLHPALLPAWRGSAPVHSMVQAGRAAEDGGVTLHVMVERFDAGDIVEAIAVPLRPDQDWNRWRQALARAAGTLVDRGILPFMAGEIEPKPQDTTPAPRSRTADRRFIIDSATTADEARAFLRLLGHAQSLDLNIGSEFVRIVGRIRRLGPPTGQLPQIHPLSVTMDLADARCRFRRRLSGASWRFRLRRLLSLISARY
jgi:hypothetical protein